MNPAKVFPEAQWKFRRWYVWGVSVGSGLLLLVGLLNNAPAGVAYALCGLVGWVATLYMAGPSAEHVTTILKFGDVIKAALNKGTSYGEVMSVPPDEVG